MVFFGILTVLIIIIDQAIKQAVLDNVKAGEQIKVISGLLNVTYVENRGAAFGMLQNRQMLFVVMGLAIIVAFWYMIFIRKINGRLFLLSAALIVGGGVGNILDRVFRGFVIDYIQVPFFPPVCNFADYCITAGTVLLVVYLLFFENKGEDKELQAKREK